MLVQVVDELARRGPRATRRPRRSRTSTTCWAYSQSPTPPACGQTGTPNFAASSTTASTSLTPPSRQQSSWQTSIAPSCSSCLKTTRFCTCSPVATRTGATASRMRAWPRMSSGLVGSSIHHGSTSRSAPIASIACSTPHAWFASSESGARARSRRGRAVRAPQVARRGRRPTFSFRCVKPSSSASRARSGSVSSA